MTNCNVLAIYFLLFLNYNQTPDPSPLGEGRYCNGSKRMIKNKARLTPFSMNNSLKNEQISFTTSFYAVIAGFVVLKLINMGKAVNYIFTERGSAAGTINNRDFDPHFPTNLVVGDESRGKNYLVKRLWFLATF